MRTFSLRAWGQRQCEPHPQLGSLTGLQGCHLFSCKGNHPNKERWLLEGHRWVECEWVHFEPGGFCLHHEAECPRDPRTEELVTDPGSDSGRAWADSGSLAPQLVWGGGKDTERSVAGWS